MLNERPKAVEPEVVLAAMRVASMGKSLKVLQKLSSVQKACINQGTIEDLVLSSMSGMGVRIFLGILGIFLLLSLLFSTVKSFPLTGSVFSSAITAIDQDGNQMAFAEVYPREPTLVYSSTQQQTLLAVQHRPVALRDAFEALKAQKPHTTAASRGSRIAQKTFHSKYNIPPPLIANTNGAVARIFGVPLLMEIYSSRRTLFTNKNGEVVWKSAQGCGTQWYDRSADSVGFFSKKGLDAGENSRPPKDWVDSSTVEQRPFKALVLGSNPSQPM